jgi:large subunit ribosomal protein L10
LGAKALQKAREMPTEKKVEAVRELTEALARSTVVIGADYRGLKVSDATALRRQLNEAGVEMHVVKNTLFWRAAEAAGKQSMVELAEGPTALIIGFADPIAPIKTVLEYQRTARNTFAARKAFLEGQVYQANRLNDLATLPSKETLIAQVAGAIQLPITNFVYLLQATVQELAGLLDARAEQVAQAAM